MGRGWKGFKERWRRRKACSETLNVRWRIFNNYFMLRFYFQCTILHSLIISVQVNTGGTIRLPELQLGDGESNSRERLRVDSNEIRSSPGLREVLEVGERCLFRLA